MFLLNSCFQTDKNKARITLRLFTAGYLGAKNYHARLAGFS